MISKKSSPSSKKRKERDLRQRKRETVHLIYLDESGQTGTNLRDTVQPVFVLGALVVAEACWLALEAVLQDPIEKSFPGPRPADFEIHATEISNPRSSYFKSLAISHRLAFRDQWLG